MDGMKMISTVDHCNELLVQLRRVKAGKAMFDFMEYMMRKKIEMNENTYSLIMSVCRIESDLQRACLYFGHLRDSSNIPVSVHSYRSIISVCIVCGDLESAHTYVDEMVEAGIELEAAIIAPVFKRLGYEKQHSAKAADLCTAIIKEMERQHVRLTREICSSAAWTYSNAEHDEKLLALYEMMQEQGVKIDEQTYNRILFTLSKKPEHLDNIIRIHEEMKERGIKPTLYAYHLILRGLAAAHDEERSLALLEEMEQFGIEPTSVTYTSVINSFTREFSDTEKMEVWKKLEDLLNKMAAQRVEPDPLLYVALVNVCIVTGDRDRAEKFFGEMKAAGISRDEGVFCRLIKVYAETTDEDETMADAERISALLEQMKQEGFQLDAVSCAEIIRGLNRSKSIEKAQPFMKQMFQSGVRYDKLLLIHLLEFCVAVDENDMMTDVVDRALKQKNLPDTVVHTILLQTLIQFEKTAEVIEQLQKMKADGVRFNKITYSVLKRLSQCEVSEEERLQIDAILGPDSPFQQ